MSKKVSLYLCLLYAIEMTSMAKASSFASVASSSRMLPAPYETPYTPSFTIAAIDDNANSNNKEFKSTLSPGLKLASVTSEFVSNLWSKLKDNELIRSLVASSISRISPPTQNVPVESTMSRRHQYQQPFPYYDVPRQQVADQGKMRPTTESSGVSKSNLSQFLPVITQLMMLWPTIHKLLASLRATDRSSSVSSVLPDSNYGATQSMPVYAGPGVEYSTNNDFDDNGVASINNNRPQVQTPSLGSMAVTLLSDLIAQHAGRVSDSPAQLRRKRSPHNDQNADFRKHDGGNRDITEPLGHYEDKKQQKRSFLPLLTSADSPHSDSTTIVEDHVTRKDGNNGVLEPTISTLDSLALHTTLPTTNAAMLAPYTDDHVANAFDGANEHLSQTFWPHSVVDPQHPDVNQTMAEHELDIVKSYLLNIRPHQHDEYNDEIIATYLSCSGMSSPDDHCLERLACVFGDSSATFMVPLERDVTSIVIYSILKNTHVDSRFKARLKAAARAGNADGSHCQALYPCNKQSK
ncbi:hypothetical protein GZH46_02619 [Fragariocoptes setiger]|uniref:Uncharacterized protein n=1 Tax=Fragariocoptes setiger TaxID=1670756 RepID=A0ABQ7S628_9ACAR|nr:hypothetical protein GZH46_02619 [Fragariocoptes setiger]